MSICIATIVSANYLAYAKTLADSVAACCPDFVFRVLVVERPSALVQESISAYGLDATFATELPLADFERIAFKYDILELNTALKPTFLKLLLDEGHDRVLYLDPDILLFARPDAILVALETQSIALTPHSLNPILDGKRPSDIDFLRSGVFNLGFVAVNATSEARAFLDWWEARCLSYGFNDTGFGIFVDQKWANFVPAYFPSYQVIRHPGCNVAYWNLHERELEWRDGACYCNGQPLIFFHFSGVNAFDPSLLSKHQNRHVLEPGTPLASLVADYCRRLLDAGHAAQAKIPYSFRAFSDGAPISATARRASVLPSPAPFDPFSSSGVLHGLFASSGPPPPRGMSTMSYDPRDRRIVWVNRLIRVVTRVIGIDRTSLLLRYCAFVVQESNYAAVVMNVEPSLKHHDRRPS